MRFVTVLLSIYCLFTLPAQAQSATIPVVDLTVHTGIHAYAKDVMGDKKLLEIDDFSGSNSPRDMVEFILLQQAIALGGMKVEFNILEGNYGPRNVRMLRDGLLMASSDSVWYSEAKQISQDVYISEPLIRKGEYKVGLFTAINNQKALAVKTLDDFRQHSVVSSSTWVADWETLTNIKPRKLLNQRSWMSMVRLVSGGWIDFMLIPYPGSRPFVIAGDEYKVKAVEGVSMMIDDSRHFLVSRHHPLGKEAYEALSKGLAILRKEGKIARAYQQSGFFNPLVKDWSAINLAH